MIKHEFILVSKVPDEISICDYVREEMIVISDDFILENYVPIRRVKMLWDAFRNIEEGINYHGTTIINSCMAKELKNELLQYCKDSEDLRKLVCLLEQAIADNKYIIHFGV